ncbi:MAG: hypothetical protein QOF02_2806 [Blastocatellia bacterium]|jgi:hypothetical protein|nr:hypothetical protein [Blastocatellia bacterium]
MLRSSLARWIGGTLMLIAVLGVLRFKPWKHLGGLGNQPVLARAQLSVGFLPVT